MTKIISCDYTVTFQRSFNFCGMFYVEHIPYKFTATFFEENYDFPTPQQFAIFDYSLRFCSCTAEVKEIVAGKLKKYEI